MQIKNAIFVIIFLAFFFVLHSVLNAVVSQMLPFVYFCMCFHNVVLYESIYHDLWSLFSSVFKAVLYLPGKVNPLICEHLWTTWAAVFIPGGDTISEGFQNVL